MAYVKLDKDILSSSLWMDSDTALIFITALLMAEPFELTEAAPELETTELKQTGFVVPPGWYGMVRSSGPGLISFARLPNKRGVAALEALANPDKLSRSQEYGGRRLVRVNGGFIMLNYIRFREKDHKAAERMRNYRQRQKQTPKKEKPPRQPRRPSRMQQLALVGQPPPATPPVGEGDRSARQ
jgi:hypothetical protein